MNISVASLHILRGLVALKNIGKANGNILVMIRHRENVIYLPDFGCWTLASNLKT